MNSTLQPAAMIALKTTEQQKSGTPIPAPVGKFSALIAKTSPALPDLSGKQLPSPLM
jgi:hypothetical protein